jgi:hypothetical protein
VPKAIESLGPTFQQNRSLSERQGTIDPVVIFLDLRDFGAMKIAVALEKFTGAPAVAAKTVRDSRRAGTTPTMVTAGPRDGIADLLRESSPLASRKIRADPPAGQFWIVWVAEGRTRLVLMPIEEPPKLPDLN